MNNSKNTKIIESSELIVPGLKKIIENLDGSKMEYEYMDPSAEKMEKLFRDLYENHWNRIRFGPCVQGSVFELSLTEKPRVSMLDGYLTVHAGSWHFHICVGKYEAQVTHFEVNKDNLEEEARQKRVSKAAFLRTLDGSDSPRSWSLRFWNGLDEQMISIFLPNPYLNDQLQRQKEADWSKLELWENLRKDYLGHS